MNNALTDINSQRDNQTNPVETLRQLRLKRDPSFLLMAEKYLLLSRNWGDLAMQAGIIFEQSVYHNNVSSRYHLSIKLAKRALGLARKLGLVSLHAEALRMLGVNYNFLGKLIKAQTVCIKGIELLEPLPNKSKGDLTSLAGLYFNLVSLYKGIEIDSTRVQYIDRAFELYNEIGDRRGVARTYLMYASFYPGIKGTDKVVDYYQKAADIFREENDVRGLGNSLMNLGNHYCALENFTEGMPLLMAGIDYVKQAGSEVYIINGLFNLATAFRKQRKFDEALEQFKLVEQMIDDSKTGLNMTGFYEEYSLALEESGDAQAALEVYKKFYHHKESVNRFDKTAAVSEAKVSLELQMRRKETEMLRATNKEVEAYSRKLEISNRELQQFAHIASHDLKEPLRMVSSYMQILDKKLGPKINDEERELLLFAKNGAKRMFELINGVLDLSKIGNESIAEDVDLNDVLSEVSEMLRMEIDRRRLIIDACQLPVVKGNRIYLIQLFQNLIGNAMKYNESPIPMLKISCLVVSNQYHFSFSDNGIGITEKHRERVFEIFQRLHGREEYSGTGLGLTICKKIVTQMAGTISIHDSKLGGSDFRIALPK